MKLRSALGLLAAGLVAASFFLAPFFPLATLGPSATSRLAPAPEARPASTPALARSPEPHAPSSAPAAQASQKAAVGAALGTQMRQSGNLSAFIHEALQRPGQGGLFYAHVAWLQCTQARTSWQRWGDQTLQGRKAEAQAGLRTWMARCADFEAQQGGTRQLLGRLVGPAARSQDPLLAAEARGLALSLAEVAALGSAELLGQRLSEERATLLAAFQPRLEPQVFDLLAGAAALSVACELDGSCASSVLALNTCLMEEDCQSLDLREQLPLSMPTALRGTLRAMIATLRAAVAPSGAHLHR